MPQPHLTTSEPISVFQKPLTIDAKKLFASVAKGVLHGVSGKWEELAGDAADAIAAIGLVADPAELAFLLIKRSLVKALFEIVAESINQLLIDESASEEQLIDRMDFSMLSTEIYLDNAFLDRPSEIPVIANVQSVFGDWLVRHGAPISAAKSISNRFPSYFVYAMNSEWRQNQKTYAPILKAIQTPFARAGEREWAWETYSAMLQKRTHEGVFDEPFSINQIYVPLKSFYLEEGKQRQAMEEIAHTLKKKNRVVVDLATELDDWLEQAPKEDSIRVISGGPGSGKSSFLRIFAARKSQEGKRVLLVPLHLIDPGKDLIEEVGRFVKDEGILLENPIGSSSPEPNLILIFDGLDEMASQGRVAAETARQFVTEIDKTVEKRNTQKVALRVLISGRELIIQENESEFRKKRQVLTLLPYHTEGGDDEYKDPKGFLKNDLRHAWWEKYGELTGKGYKGLPDVLSRSDLDEITSQPLLNYLVALSFNRGELVFDKAISLNAIYEDLVGAVYDRAYDKKRTYMPIKHMRFDEFFRVLEEIGLAAWHGDGRTTTVREIEDHCKLSGVGPLLGTFKEGAEAGVTRLLAAFFFRKYGYRQSGEPTFVFTHKSFGEYLAARRIGRCIDRIVRERRSREKDPDAGWSEKDALSHWAQICGPSPISTYLHPFLTGEMAMRSVIEAEASQQELARLFSLVLRYGIPLDSPQLRSFREALFHARNAEEALLVALNACARKTEAVSLISQPDPIAFGAWLRRIQGQRSGPEPSLAAKCLSFLDLSGAVLHISDLYGADLHKSVLRRLEAMYVNLGEANLTDTDCTRAVFARGCLEHAKFNRANLSNAILAGADLSHADLRGANLVGAALEPALELEGKTKINPTLAYAKISGIKAEKHVLSILARLKKKSSRGKKSVTLG